MHSGVTAEPMIFREKRRDLLHQAEQDRLIRLARAGRETKTKAGRRAWGRLQCWLCQVRLSRRTDRWSRIGTTGQYLLNAFYWAGKE